MAIELKGRERQEFKTQIAMRIHSGGIIGNRLGNWVNANEDARIMAKRQASDVIRYLEEIGMINKLNVPNDGGSDE